MRLYIAEKPELARAIVSGLGGGEEKSGYFKCGDDIVTYCKGHMLVLCDPEEYNPQYEKWCLDHLPLHMDPFKKKPNPKHAKQLNIIIGLLKKATEVVNAGDPDPEGQMLVDEILKQYGYTGPAKRLLINDNNTEVVKRALANMKNNSEYAGLSAAAEVARVGDQRYGYNMSRLYTLIARRSGNQNLLTVGRVQTPILGLVVRRDRENANHTKKYFYNIMARFSFNGITFIAGYDIKTEDPQDEKGRITEKEFAGTIVQEVSGQPARIKKAETFQKETPPPLPFSLLDLQAEAARVYNMKPDEVKQITQDLRIKHQAITYNRSNSRHLSEEQHCDAPGVLKAIGTTSPTLMTLIENTDTQIKSRAFDSSKVGAHHAIVPTQAIVSPGKLNPKEQQIYDLIARAYIIQFFPPYQYELIKVTVASGDHTFSASAQKPGSLGWKAVYVDPEEEAQERTDGLAVLQTDNDGSCVSAETMKNATKPRPLFTMSTLLTALTKIAQEVQDPHLKKMLMDKDKNNPNENGGIGTPATRDEIIKGLFDRGFLTTQKNGKTENIVSSKAAQDFYDVLPANARNPDMTALWHEQQVAIERGQISPASFLKELDDYIQSEIDRIQKEGLKFNLEFHPCPTCGMALILKKGAKGDFWACSQYPACRVTLPHVDGKPGSKPTVSEIHTCLNCGKGLIKRAGKNGKQDWWGCSGYPGCSTTYSDKRGRPDFDVSKPKTDSGKKPIPTKTT